MVSYDLAYLVAISGGYNIFNFPCDFLRLPNFLRLPVSQWVGAPHCILQPCQVWSS